MVALVSFTLNEMNASNISSSEHPHLRGNCSDISDYYYNIYLNEDRAFILDFRFIIWVILTQVQLQVVYEKPCL